MRFLVIYSYTPENRKAVVERRLKHGPMDPPGVRILGEWSYVGGGKVFRLIETEDPKTLIAMANAWGDLGQIETYPVMDTAEVLQYLV